jgi:chromosome segregation ATPase
MFKKLKEKITEEVKSSPQRFQQLTQSMSDRLQNSSTSDENFFSIGDDDANTSNASFEAGFTNVSLTSPQETRYRRNSSSSVASDVSFLPRYESIANMYHLQSDLDISASEIEDNASTSSQLGHLSKEQIYSAFKKAQMRYHKYRGRYTDLAKHYKELERENTKMKSVLVETQDKAIRRVTELKEQCSLEQKAKAHLESALRDEIDEKLMKIQSLQTKIELLQNGVPSSQDVEMEHLNRYLTDARQEIESLNERIQEMKANLIIFQTKEQEYKGKITSLEKEIAQFSEREKENNLSLAQNKMELHNELLGKDTEISNLKKEMEGLKKSLEGLTSGSNKLENLQTQNMKLIEKLENLTQKCNNYENELLKMEQFKIEAQNSNQANSELKNRLKDAEDKLEEVREEAKKSLLSLESKVREKLEKEFGKKEEEMREEFKRKFEEVSSNQSNLQEMKLNLVEKDDEIKKLREVNEEVLEELTVKATKYDDLERNHLELIEEGVGLRSKISNLEKELAGMQNVSQTCDLKISRLEGNVKSLEREIEVYKELEDKLQLVEEDKKNLLDQLNEDQVKKLEEAAKKTDEMKLLASKLQNLEEENKSLLEDLEKERQSVQEQSQINTKLNQEMNHLKALIQKREASLEEKKKDIESKLEVEKEKLLGKLKESEITVKNLEQTSLSLNEELVELKTKNEEIALLQAELQNSDQQKKKLGESLNSKENQVRSLEEINAKLSYTYVAPALGT